MNQHDIDYVDAHYVASQRERRTSQSRETVAVVELTELQTNILREVDRLPMNQRVIVLARHGLLGTMRPETYPALAKMLNTTVARVHRAERAAVRQLLAALVGLLEE